MAYTPAGSTGWVQVHLLHCYLDSLVLSLRPKALRDLLISTILGLHLLGGRVQRGRLSVFM